MNSSDEAAVRLRQQVAEVALDRHDDDLSLVRLVAINDAFPLIEAAVRAEAVAAERQRWERLVRAHLSPEGVGGPDQAARNSVLQRVLAAGSVPVATPKPAVQAVNCEVECGKPADRTCAQWGCGQVATPTEPRGQADRLGGSIYDPDDEGPECGWLKEPDDTRYGCQLPGGHSGKCEAASPVPAEQAAEPPAASWGDLAADVMGLVDRTLDGEPPVPTGQPAPWFRESPESLAMLDDVRAEVAAVEAAAEQSEER